MLTASERLDYGRLLRAPEGHVFASGIATSYSLDLAALTAAALALTLELEPDEAFEGERIAILDSLDQLQGRLSVFHQAGKVLVPRKFNRLWTLLEPLLVGVIARGHAGAEAFTSFHPKLWLLRYRPLRDRQPDVFRLIVLSRNITFDRSWDLAVAVDGVRQKTQVAVNRPLKDFLVSLLPHAPHSAALADLLDHVSYIAWERPDKIRELRMLPGGGAHVPNSVDRFDAPKDFGDNIGDVLVMSPFLDAGPESLLSDLRTASKRCWLVSRAETLNRIGPSPLVGWECYSMHPALVDVEERHELPDPKLQDLHAKVIVTTSGDTTHWHLGSANCTEAAFGKTGRPPRNTEFMLRMTTSADEFRPRAILDAWKKHNPQLFMRHEFAAVEPDDERRGVCEKQVRLLVYRLSAADWQLTAQPFAEDAFELDLLGTPILDLGTGFSVGIRPTGVAVARSLEESLRWSSVRLVDVSAFVEFTLTTPYVECNTAFVLQVRLLLKGNLDRREALFREIVNTPEKLLQYVGLLLDSQAGPGRWRGNERGKRTSGDVFGLDHPEELFEHLMHCVAREPHRIDRVLDVLEKMKGQDVPLPEGLATMLDGFRTFRDSTR